MLLERRAIAHMLNIEGVSAKERPAKQILTRCADSSKLITEIAPERQQD
jgi:hypothetical protein